MFIDKLRITVVNYESIWGDKDANIAKMLKIIDEAVASNTEMIVFPETALTGYDNIENTPRSQKIHTLLAEKIDGPSIKKISEVAKNKNIYIIFGFSELDSLDEKTVYNSAAICSPAGEIISYRKMHIPGDEADWSACGDWPVVFDTKWGPVGIGICYDTYSFPEIIRYARAKGARLFINCTACSSETNKRVPFRMQLEEHSLTNHIYIASADLCGHGPICSFIGGSSIIGTSTESIKEIQYYAGYPFNTEGSEIEGCFTADLDLAFIDSCFNTPLFSHNPRTGHPDYRPDIYRKMFEELCEDENWMKKSQD